MTSNIVCDILIIQTDIGKRKSNIAQKLQYIAKGVAMEKEFIDYQLPTLRIAVNKYEMNLGRTYRGPHLHKEVEVVFVSKGSVLCRINNNEISLTENDAVLINGYTVHCIESVGDADVTIVQADVSKLFDELTDGDGCYIDEFILKSRPKGYFIERSKGELYRAAEAIAKEWESKRKCYDIYVKAHLFYIAAFMCRKGLLAERNDVIRNDMAEIMPVVEFIEHNFSDKLSLEKVCENSLYSKYHLCRVFKKVTGGTVFEYVNYVRMRKAEEMLCNSGKTVLEVAYECGYASPQYFNRDFKRHTGCSPGKFKKLI